MRIIHVPRRSVLVQFVDGRLVSMNVDFAALSCNLSVVVDASVCFNISLQTNPLHDRGRRVAVTEQPFAVAKTPHNRDP